MILTWVFRALFVPLLVLAIITSNCSATEIVNAAGAELAAINNMSPGGPFTVAASVGRLWRDAATDWTSVHPRHGFDLLLECL